MTPAEVEQHIENKLFSVREKVAQRVAEELIEHFISSLSAGDGSVVPKKRTGRLAQSHTFEAWSDGSYLEVSVKSSAPYSGFLNFGTSGIDPFNYVEKLGNSFKERIAVIIEEELFNEGFERI